jgi:adenylate cyclase
VPLNADGNFDLTLFAGEQLPPGYTRWNKPFTEQRLWNLGLVLAAHALDLDLNRTEVDLARQRIVIPGSNGPGRVIPVDREGWMYIDWALRSADPRLTSESLESLLARDQLRSQGLTEGGTEKWKGKLVIIGSEATGNELTDRGATPLENDIPLMTKHWNVANSVIQDRFVARAGFGVETGLIILVGTLSAILTMRLRILVAFATVLLTVMAYTVVAAWSYVSYRYWLPMIIPICGAGFVQYAVLATYRVIFEQDQKRKVKALFSRLVSPNIVNELLQVKQLSLTGARSEITVLFADVRGFTELTDRTYERALGEVARRKLGPEESQRLLDEAARLTLETVNLYLSMLADIVKRHDGTLDKYIGDCVMAFWGAPSPQPQHALACVRAAIEAQRSIHQLNETRQAENERRKARIPTGSAATDEELPLLQMGSGINTGLASVGLMGSDEHIYNYTVFGREVNLASRLESLSGRGRIIVGETTFKHLQRDDPELAARCKALQPEKVKGFRDLVQVYEVPWHQPAANLKAGEPGASATPERGQFTPASQ